MLATTPVFADTGAYLFRDRRNPPVPRSKKQAGPGAAKEEEADEPPPAPPPVATEEGGGHEAPQPMTLAANISRAWPLLHPEWRQQGEEAVLPPHLLETDLFRGLTDDYGESAVVLWEHSERTAPATDMLTRLVDPLRIQTWHFGWVGGSVGRRVGGWVGRRWVTSQLGQTEA